MSSLILPCAAILLTGLLLAAGESSAESRLPVEYSLDGEWKVQSGHLRPLDLFRADLDDSDWRSMAVPLNWYLGGVDASGAMWYRRAFDVEKPRDASQASLCFEGVDYAADVWLNETYLGFHEGYFEPFCFEVEALLNYGATNHLAVRVDSPEEKARRDWSLNKRLIKGVLGHHDTRPGGAWTARGQERNSGGIWAPVYLRFTGSVAISALKARPTFLERGDGSELPDPLSAAGVEIELDLDVHKGEAGRIGLRAWVEPEGFRSPSFSGGRTEQKVRVNDGRQSVELSVPCENVHLWWTWDHGASPLYRVVVEVLRGSRVVDRREEIIGFRTVAYDAGDSALRLNGRRLFLRGTNYIGSHWLAELSAAHYAEDLTMMRRGHINAVRVHAHVAGRDFYRESDRLGLLIWQDFPLQWGYEDTPELHSEVMRQAEAMVDSLYHHPSIGVWSGHNEPPWDADWMKYKYQHYVEDQNRALDEELGRVLERSDPSRYVHAVSLTEEHPWLGWYSGHWTDYLKPTSAVFVTEFGAQAVPDLETLRQILPAEALYPEEERDWEVWRHHNFQPHESFELAGLRKTSDPSALAAESQAYQAQLVQLAAESLRRQRFSPVAAAFQFMWVEAWPSINWALVDYQRHPKSGFRTLATAFQPLLPSIEWHPKPLEVGDSARFRFWVVNDLPETFAEATFGYRLSRGGQAVAEERQGLTVAADSVAHVSDLEMSLQEPGSYVLEAWIEVGSNQRRPFNQLSFAVSAAKETKASLEAPATTEGPDMAEGSEDPQEGL
ncbi:MAG: sugar-binding domain-containing protein [Acidobacteriota bacterium]